MQCTPKTISHARSVSGALSTVVLLAATACGRDDDANRAAAGGDAATTGATPALPAPEGAVGSVTGMPAHPGPGTSRITPVEPVVSAQGAWADDIDEDPYGDAYTEVDRVDLVGEDTLVDAPPIIILPEPPSDPIAIGIDPGAPDPALPPRQPIGTEAATESTTFVAEPTEPDD